MYFFSVYIFNSCSSIYYDYFSIYRSYDLASSAYSNCSALIPLKVSTFPPIETFLPLTSRAFKVPPTFIFEASKTSSTLAVPPTEKSSSNLIDRLAFNVPPTIMLLPSALPPILRVPPTFIFSNFISSSISSVQQQFSVEFLLL